MAVDDGGGEIPRCLAMVRYMVATVVTVLAVVVIVMVITVGVLRPEEIRLSVVHGHVTATDLWYMPTTTTYVAANYVSFGLTLRAENPSGRANINCSNITVNFFDYNYATATENGIGWLSLPNLSFVVTPKSSHMLVRWGSFNNTGLLTYLANKYRGRTSFTGAVHVNMTTISSITLVTQRRARNVSHYCGPLTFSVAEPSVIDDKVTCKRSDGEDPLLV